MLPAQAGRHPSLPPHPVSRVGLPPGTWLTVTVRPSGPKELRCGHSHAPALPAAGLPGSPVKGAPGSAQATAPQRHRYTDADRPYTERHQWDTRGRHTHLTESPRPSQSLLRWKTPTLTPVSDPCLQGETTMPSLQVGLGCWPSRSSTWLSPLTWYLRSRSLVLLAKGDYPPVQLCVLLFLLAHQGLSPVRLSQRAGPKLLTAGPIPYQFLSFYIRPFYLFLPPKEQPRTQARAGVGSQLMEGRGPTLLGPSAISLVLSGGSGQEPHAQARSSQQWLPHSPGSPGAQLRSRARNGSYKWLWQPEPAVTGKLPGDSRRSRGLLGSQAENHSEKEDPALSWAPRPWTPLLRPAPSL